MGEHAPTSTHRRGDARRDMRHVGGMLAALCAWRRRLTQRTIAKLGSSAAGEPIRGRLAAPAEACGEHASRSNDRRERCMPRHEACWRSLGGSLSPSDLGTGSHAPRLARSQMCCRPPGATGLRATKWCLPDKEEVRGSNPRAPTSDLQGFLPFATPPDPPSAIILQPKRGW